MKQFYIVIIFVLFLSCSKNVNKNENANSRTSAIEYMIENNKNTDLEINENRYGTDEENIIFTDTWHSELLEKWNSYNLYAKIQNRAVYKTLVADEPTNIYDFNDGKTIIDIIDKGIVYLGLAITRFKIENTDKNWTCFLVVKYKDNTNFWDGVIKINPSEFNEFIRYNMLFLNSEWCKVNPEYNYPKNKSIITIDDQIGEMPIVYLIDYAEEIIYSMNTTSIELKKLSSEYAISFLYIGNINEIEYEFSIRSDEILFGKVIWNIKSDEIKTELITPNNSIPGKED